MKLDSEAQRQKIMVLINHTQLSGTPSEVQDALESLRDLAATVQQAEIDDCGCGDEEDG